LEIHLQDRPLADDMDLGKLCDLLEGYTGADIKNIAQRAASIPFMESIAGQQPRPIAMKDLLVVIEDTPRSVQESDLGRFERFIATGK
jgi:SpoVK/Ycf46/Vps4 family AAA+-type ATPase